jgi:hypothetical protein
MCKKEGGREMDRHREKEEEEVVVGSVWVCVCV